MENQQVKGFALYTVYLHHKVIRAVVVKESDAKLLAAKWQCVVKPITIEEV